MSASAPTNGLPRPTDRRRATAAIVTLLVIFSSIVTSGTASAHTGFESSTPSDGAATDAPVELVTIVFTGEATPVGDEFVALTPDGVLQQPSNVETLDNKLFSIRFDPPLAGGQVGIRWNVQAADAHPIEGAFSFTVNAPAPTTTPPPTAPPTTAAVAAQPAETIAPAETESQAAIPADDDATAAVASDSDGGAGASAEPTAETANPAVATTQSLDDFLEVDNSTPGQSTATVGRLVGFLGIA
ncbi:copper resistance CopC family protein, partial [Ilumatobacter sp.]|uniref:copper resistance CopC family protein n=1 Tax=Ilumatobacter sp. TaxID=1967498 RepID=UPI003AF732AE